MTGPRDTVVSLACARFEDALSEGILDPTAEAHARECPACDELAELVFGEAGIVAATASVPVSASFVDSVLERALSETAPLHRIRPATDDLRVAQLEAALEHRRRRTSWIAAAALVAGLLVAAGAYSVFETAADGDPQATEAGPQAALVSKGSTNASAATPTAAPAQTLSPRAPGESLPAAAGAPARTQAPAAAPNKAPEASPADAVPEPVVDIPSEIRALLVRKIRTHAACPKRNRSPVRVTLTVGLAGKVTSPQVLSGSGNSKAHQCVSYALDRLLLPPLERAVTVTLDLTW